MPALVDIGFVLRVRQPDWQQHRMLRHETPTTNLHVFGPDATEVPRMVAFRDWLRANTADRTTYDVLKRDLAGQHFESIMAYNNVKAGLIYDIYERIFAADHQHPHTPHPRPLV